MREQREELYDFLAQGRFWKPILGYLLLAIVVIILAVYVGILLFGTNSVEVLYNLNIKEKNLNRHIDYLKRENARLQKEYFELKEMEPDQ